MPKHQILMGAAVALLSVAAFWKTEWLIQQTRKGQWFARRFGDAKARLIIRGFFFAAILFGILLAVNVIQPLRW